MKKAALYLRSSKDRKDVSIQHQRTALTEFARDRGLTVVTEFTDVVESGKSEFRPGFQQLTADLKRPSRLWDTILILDTSRLGRRRYIGEAFKHECSKRGVEVLFKSLPDVDPISRVILESVMTAMDEVHSLMSRDKGLAGMAQNIEQGFRAGGRAPRGYQLRRVDTSKVRDGAVLTKSLLEPSADAERVARYLQLRAEGVGRLAAKRTAGITWPSTSLVGMEWNALTYAGHTVWNVHNETNPGGGYKGGTKRRPRDQWHIKRDTHPALITTDEAEQILHQLETSNVARSIAEARRSLSSYLLSGLLHAPDGRQWIGQRGRYYRLRAGSDAKGRQVPAADVDQVVRTKILADFTHDAFLDGLLATAREQPAQAGPGMQAELRQVEQQINRMMEIAGKMADPAPAIRRADALEARRRELIEAEERQAEERACQAALSRVTRQQLRQILTDLLERMTDPEALQGLVGSVVERVELCPETLHCTMYYQIPVRLDVASPRGFEPRSPP